MMEKLVHKSNGELVLDNPFRTVGTVVRYQDSLRLSNWNYGVITEECLACLKDERYISLNKDTTVWALWNFNSPEEARAKTKSTHWRPAWMHSDSVEVVE